jgi:hypothetical protein
MGFLLQLLGLARPNHGREPRITVVGPIVPASTAAEPQPRTALPCPSCAVLIDPPPVRSRRCPACREPIVVRHLEAGWHS